MIYFVHIPRTGGSSVLRLLDHYNVNIVDHNIRRDGHQYLKDIKKEGDIAFGIVRNPFERLKSSYSYILRGGNNKFDAEDTKKYWLPYKSFEDFILNGLEWISQKQIHFKPVVDWTNNNNNDLLLDHVVHYENLDSQLKELGNKYRINFSDLTHVNKSQKDGLTFTEDMKNKVLDIYKEDFKQFDYG